MEQIYQLGFSDFRNRWGSLLLRLLGDVERQKIAPLLFLKIGEFLIIEVLSAISAFVGCVNLLKRSHPFKDCEYQNFFVIAD